MFKSLFYDFAPCFFLWLGAEDRDEEKDYVCVEEHIQCPAIPHCSPQSLQAAMQLVNIQTLAFTPPNTLPWRVYLYTHTQHTHSADTLILGELLYTGGANQTVGVETADKMVVESKEEEHVEQKESVRKDGGVKVTLKQQPRDDAAVRVFLSILTTVLHTLSSERA